MAQADDDDYGILTLLVQLDFEPRGMVQDSAGMFFPVAGRGFRVRVPGAPRDSRCCRKISAPAFVKIVKRGFSQRRKMMLKLLKQDWPADKLAAAFAELKISPQERAEKLSLEQFVALTKILSGEISAPPN